MTPANPTPPKPDPARYSAATLGELRVGALLHGHRITRVERGRTEDKGFPYVRVSLENGDVYVGAPSAASNAPPLQAWELD